MFKLSSKYKPKGDQPKAIKNLVKGYKENKKHQVLKGVTGSGKTFTIANFINQIQKQTIIIAPNKTLAAQLYSEFKEFFPENKVEYFVSYFDYYKPEAYLPSKDIYIDKVSKRNLDLEAMRMSALNSLATRKDTIVVASVAAIYGTMNPLEYQKFFYQIFTNQKIEMKKFFLEIIKIGFERNDIEPEIGTFSVKGDVVYVMTFSSDEVYIRIDFFDNKIDSICQIDKYNKNVINKFQNFIFYPAQFYTIDKNNIAKVTSSIYEELAEQINFFAANNKLIEKQRIEERVKSDIEAIEEWGFCPGIENYSRIIDGRKPGEKPYTLFDFLDDKGIIIIDESHNTIPQISGMFNGDYKRKKNLVDYGFRLPSALDNRPLNFEEFSQIQNHKIYVSATPGDYEIDLVYGEIIPQIIRPTGLLDPIIEIRKKTYQMQDIFDELQQQIYKKERTIIIALTKKSAEEISLFLAKNKIKSYYLHSEHKTFERNEIIRKLRKGIYDVIVGINLLREGIDIPEVSLICVLEADLNGFLRNTKSLIQIAGRAARNDHGKVILYADSKSLAIQNLLEENNTNRNLQIKYNLKNKIIPKTIKKPIPDPIQITATKYKSDKIFTTKNNQKEKENQIKILKKEMELASKKRNYERAIEIRDLILEIGGNL